MYIVHHIVCTEGYTYPSVAPSPPLSSVGAIREANEPHRALERTTQRANDETKGPKKRGESSYLIASRDILFRPARYIRWHHPGPSISVSVSLSLFLHRVHTTPLNLFPMSEGGGGCSIIVIRYVYAGSSCSVGLMGTQRASEKRRG